MSINKKIILFCIASLISISVLLVDRGAATESQEQNRQETKEPVSVTGRAVITSMSGAAVRGEEEQEGKSPGKGMVGNEEGVDGQTDIKTYPPDEEAGVRSTSSPSGGTRKKESSDPPEQTDPGTSVKKPDKSKKASEKNRATKKPAVSSPPEAKPSDAARATAGNSVANNPVPSPKDERRSECFLQITCSEALAHMDKLKESVKKVIPSDGIILQGTVAFEEGDTAFDVLKAACADQNILLDYVFTPGFSTYYIKGINHLYEFDCGDESGWMYSVNGKNPDYGCSQYKLGKGDRVIFYYTCERS